MHNNRINSSSAVKGKQLKRVMHYDSNFKWLNLRFCQCERINDLVWLVRALQSGYRYNYCLCKVYLPPEGIGNKYAESCGLMKQISKTCIHARTWKFRLCKAVLKHTKCLFAIRHMQCPVINLSFVSWQRLLIHIAICQSIAILIFCVYLCYRAIEIVDN